MVFAGVLLGLALATALGCGGEKGEADSAPSGPIQPELAARGQELFQVKGCIACHTVGKGRLVGPDLKDVVHQRSYRWTLAMIMQPDSMLRADSIAKQLLAEYFTPMTGQNVSAEEARAIYEFLRREASSTPAP